jgi:FKBP-type peptidyl-prolyl cis-trans isomerase FkpA
MRVQNSKKLFRLTSFVYFSIVSFCLVSCHPNSEDHQKKDFDKHKVKQQFVVANQKLVMKENDEMDYYQKTHQMTFTKTSSGIRYFVYKPSLRGDSISDGDIIKIHYKVSLLDGTECYSSFDKGPREFKVAMEDIEDGVHKAVQFLKNGDKALVLIPSHLAHGLMGDQKKIPPQSPILYDLEIISVSKSN